MKTADPRIQRTRRLLSQAALEVLEREGWDAMSPHALCRRAGVGRSTFYLHYAGVHEPLAQELVARLQEETRELLADPDDALHPTTLLRSGKPLSYPFYAHVERHRGVYAAILGDARGASTRALLETWLAEASRSLHAPLRSLARRSVDADYMAALLAGALMGTARWWLCQAAPPPSALKMSYEFSLVVAPGVLARLGLDEDDSG